MGQENGVSKDVYKNDKKGESIFNTLDKNNDGVLSRSEMQNLEKTITDNASKHGKANKLGNKEFKNILKAIGLDGKGFSMEDLRNFLSKFGAYGNVNDIVDKVETGTEEHTAKTDTGKEVKYNLDITTITYKNGDVETRIKDFGEENFHKDTVRKKESRGTTLTNYYNADGSFKEGVREGFQNGQITKQVVDEKGKLLKQEYAVDGINYETSYEINEGQSEEVQTKKYIKGANNTQIELLERNASDRHGVEGKMTKGWRNQRLFASEENKPKIDSYKNYNNVGELLDKLIEDFKLDINDEDKSAVKRLLIHNNPSVFNTNGDIHADANFEKLDFPIDKYKKVETEQ